MTEAGESTFASLMRAAEGWFPIALLVAGGLQVTLVLFGFEEAWRLLLQLSRRVHGLAFAERCLSARKTHMRLVFLFTGVLSVVLGLTRL